MKTIFEYNNYREFLSHYYQEKKKTVPGFSHRSFLQKAGIRGPTFLKRVIDGERNLTETSAVRIGRAVGFGKKEMEFFVNLVLFNQEKKPEDKAYFLEQLSKFRNASDVQKVNQDQAEYLSKWYNVALRELLSCQNGHSTPQAMAQHLSPQIRPGQAKKSLELMEKLGLVSKNAEDRYEATTKLLTVDPNVGAVAIQRFHKQMIELALQAVTEHPRDAREISSVTVSIPKSAFRKIRQEIQDFQQRILNLAQEGQNVDSVYQVNFQMFPLARIRKSTKPATKA